MSGARLSLWAVVLVSFVAVASTPADGFLLARGLHEAFVDGTSNTLDSVLRLVRRCMARSNADAGHFGGDRPRPPSTPWSPPYPEPPPSSVELCALRGFKCDRHLVRTGDGYTVALIHVVGRVGRPRAAGAPVLVQHGMLMSSDAWLLRKDDDNLPLVLSDAGYDVWVGNYRGNAVSPHVHETLSPDSQQFWHFSWHEMGLHDLSAMVDHVLAQTGSEDTFYVGHSMGSTGMLVLLSSRPDYNRKIRLASFLAPVGYVSRLRSHLFSVLSSMAAQIKVFLVSQRIWNVLPRSAVLHRFVDAVCLLPGLGKILCEPVAFEIAGWSPRHVLPEYTPLITAYMPAGTTIRIMEHYYEVARTGKFRPLGAGTGDPDPGPEYNMSAVTAPVAMFYSRNDLFVHPPDVERLAGDLPNLFHLYRVPDGSFNHFDFILGSDARSLLFNEVLAVMRRRGEDAGPESNVLRTRRGQRRGPA